MKKISILIQIVSIACLGAFFGAMLMLYTAILSLWKQSSPSDFLDWYVDYASGIMDTTGPLVMSSLFLPLLCFILVLKNKQSRVYWAISFLLSVSVMAITMSYFVGVNSSFADRTIELSQISGTLDTWGKLHVVRISLAFMAAVFGGMGLATLSGEKSKTYLIV